MINKIKCYVDSMPYVGQFSRLVYGCLFGRYLNSKKIERIHSNFDVLIKLIASNDDVVIWPTFGTLLGIYRNNGPIEHDNDIDFACWLTDRDKVNIYLNSLGFFRKKCLYSKLCSEAIEDFYYNGVIGFDVFYFSKHLDEECTYDFMRKNKLSRIQTIKKFGGLSVRRLTLPIKNIAKYEYKGTLINVPSSIHEFLSARYGDDYMIENSSWSPKAKNIFVTIISQDGDEIVY